MTRKLAIRALLGLLFFYGLIAWGAQGIVDSMLYHPEYGSRRDPVGAFRLALPDGTKINALYLPNPKARYTLWYFHGNAEDLGDCEARLREFHAQGFAVFAYDYPGYGLSDGAPSESGIYAANAAALQHLTGKLGVPANRLVLYGRSLGGGPAVDLASKERVAGLILESTFTSVFRVMTRWPLLPGDQFKNARKIPRVACPILIMHGTDDRVIPFHHGKKLFDLARGPKRNLWVQWAGHNDLREMAGEAYWTTFRAFVSELK